MLSRHLFECHSNSSVHSNQEHDEDIPMGDEGTVVGFQLDSRGRRRAQVTFSYGPFALLCSDLVVVAPPAPAELRA